MSQLERILSSKQKLIEGTEFRNKEIYFDSDFDHNHKLNISFSNCTLIISGQSNVHLMGCKFMNCTFVGEVINPNSVPKGNLRFTFCKDFYNTKLTAYFKNIQISGCNVLGLTDNSISVSYRIDSNTDVLNFKILGSCQMLYLNDCTFSSHTKKTIWNKEVIKEAHCFKVTFNKIRINPYYIATKCQDKSSVDMSRATLIDKWSMLRKNYTGISLFLVFLFTFIYLLPLVTHSAVLILLGQLPAANKEHLWEALLFGGKQGLFKWLYCILTVVLFLFNAGRLWMTITISKLKEEEIFLKDSGFPMTSIAPEKYKSQLIVHTALKWLLVVSILYALFKLIDTLIIMVPVLQ